MDASRPAWLTEGVEIAVWHGGEELEVTGEYAHQDALWSIVGRTDQPVHREVYAVLVPRGGDEHDESAVSVWINGLRVGDLTSDDAAALRPTLLAALRNDLPPIGLCGHIVGGGPRLPGPRPGEPQAGGGQPAGSPASRSRVGGSQAGGPGGNGSDARGSRARGLASLGVWLEYDRAFFGLEPVGLAPPPDTARLRFGLSSAVALRVAAGTARRDTRRRSFAYRHTTDGDVGPVDLSWLDDLPDDAAQRLPRLRASLEAEADPIVRHRMMAELEAELYAFRDTFPLALLEYDEIAMQHDGEMDTIRPALIDAFGRLPQLETYRQACFRHVRAKELDMALWWARRGMQIYGDDAADDAWVADLEKRAAAIQVRIDRQGVPQHPRKRTDGVEPAALESTAASPEDSPAVPVAPHPDAATPGNAPSAPADPGVSIVELVACQTCRRTFTRQRTRTRRPAICPDCTP